MSYAIYVGRDLTAERVGYLAGYGDEPSSHWLVAEPRHIHPAGATVEVGVTAAADMPGRRSAIPQAGETFAHLRVDYSYYKGTPAPLTNGGLNEHGLAVRDVWSPSRPELVAMTPPDQSGPSYSDLARLALERARTAREGVELMGRLIAEHGHTTYGGNSHLLADAGEAWVVIQFAGGAGLWAAERLGPRSIRVSRPGYIGAVPPGGDGGRDFLFSGNLVSFAVERGWWDPASGAAFDLNAVYGDGRGRWDGVRLVEDELARRAARPGGIGFTDVVEMLRDGRLTGDSAGYGQVVPLAGAGPAALRVLWHAQVGPVTAPLTPVMLAMETVPPAFAMHRYLTAGEAEVFLDRRRVESRSAVPQAVEATASATAVMKRLQYLALLDPEVSLPEVQRLWTAWEARLGAALPDALRLARLAIEAGDEPLARRHLTAFAHEALARSLDMAERMAAYLELRLDLDGRLDPSDVPSGPDQVW